MNIRRVIGKSPEEIINKFQDEVKDEVYNYKYTGIVVNNNDPDKEGKCRIRVYGIFDDEIPDSDLPWALPDFNFIGSKVGSFIVPPVGTLVKVYFDNGDVYLPHYTTKAVNVRNLPSQKDTDYPDNMVFYETDNGDYFTINRKSKETTFNHNSETKVLIKQDGTVEINIKKEKTEVIDGNETNQIKGDKKIESPNIEVKGDSVTITGNTGPGTLQVNGQVVPNGTGPFCGLPFDPMTGAPQSGNIVTNT